MSSKYIDDFLASSSKAKAVQVILAGQLEEIFGEGAGRETLLALSFSDCDGDKTAVEVSSVRYPGRSFRILHSEAIELVGRGGRFLCEFILGQLLEERPSRSLTDVLDMVETKSTDEVITQYENSVASPDLADALKKLEAARGLIVEGESSSGKSTLLSQLSKATIQNGGNVIWIDIADSANVCSEIIRGIQCGSNNIVVIDNAQSSPAQIDRAFQLWKMFLEPGSFPIKIVIATWPVTGPYVAEVFTDFERMRLKPNELVRRIVTAYAKDAKTGFLERVWSISGGDCYIARLLSESGDDLDADALARSINARIFKKRRTTKLERATAYVLASLGQFDIPVSEAFLKHHIGSGASELLAAIKVRKSRGRLFLGHRTFCFLSSLALLRDEPELRNTYGSASDLAFQYAQGLNDSQLFDFLSRLDLSTRQNRVLDVSTPTGDQQRGFILQLWAAFDTLRNRLVRLAEQDPTFGDNIASAVFAGTVLSHFSGEIWEPISGYVRQRWLIETDGVRASGASPSTERDDFDAIVETIERGDPFEGQFRYWEQASTIDRDRFHHAWLLGLLLLFEGRAQNRDLERERLLKSCIAAYCLPSGALYPQRVVWVTARVLIGLAATGETMDSSNLIRSSIGWLKQPCPNGPLIDGSFWAHGTGTWNTPYQATAMCLAALLDLGVSPVDPIVANARSYLLERRPDWSTTENEITRIDVIDALIRAGSDWRAFRDEIQSIVTWSLDPNSWASGGSVKATEKNIESSTLPYVTSQLLQLLWTVMKDNTKEILREANQRFFESDLAAMISPEALDQEKAERAMELRGRMISWGPRVRSKLSEEIDSKIKVITQMRTGSSANLPTVRENLQKFQKAHGRLDELMLILDSRRLADSKVFEIFDEFSAIADDVLGDVWRS